jgi:hypothetical protein
MARLFYFLCVVTAFNTALASEDGFVSQSDDVDYDYYYSDSTSTGVSVELCSPACHCTSSGGSSPITVACTDGSTKQISDDILVHGNHSVQVIISHSDLTILGDNFIQNRETIENVNLKYL